jgi:hypothetical protein
MEKRAFILSSALMLLLAGTAGSDEVKTKKVRCTLSATFTSGVETHLDTNDDGRSASVHQGILNCNIGRFFFQEAAEFLASTAPVTCPAGTFAEFRLQQDHGVNIEEKTSDQLFFEVATDSGTFCLNSDLTFSFIFHGTFAGGTGQFTGASGSFDEPGTGKYLVTGEKDKVFGGFGQFSGSLTGTLILPNH